MGKLLTEQVTKESLEQAKGSVMEMTVAHDQLKDIYTQWFDKTNKIIEERKEQKQRATTSGSRTSHKWVLGAYWSRIEASRKLHSFEGMSQDLWWSCRASKAQHGYHNVEAEG